MTEHPLKKPNAAPGSLDPAQELVSDDESLLSGAEKPAVLGSLDTFGGLEVEQMRESSELQARRKGIRDTVQEQTHLDGELDEEEDEEEGGGFMDLLREANLSPRHLKFCCSGVLVLAFLIGLGFGVKALVQGWPPAWWTDLRSEDPVVEEEVPEEIPDEAPESDSFQFLDEGILTGILLGEEKARELNPGLIAGENLGEELTSPDAFARFVADFKKMFEVMEVNVQELLDQSQDRPTALKDYQNKLNFLLYLGKQNVEALKDVNIALENQFEEVQARKDQLEERFFGQLSDLDANASAASLNEFVAEAEEVVRLRAQHQARERLLLFYSRLIERMELRVQDLALNEEALIKGVKVVEVDGSDLDLILQVEE
jgi:hypothetical protein